MPEREGETALVKPDQLLDVLSENRERLGDLVRDPVKLIQVLTGAIMEDKRAWMVRAGYLLQAAFQGKARQQAVREIEELLERGKIRDFKQDDPAKPH